MTFNLNNTGATASNPYTSMTGCQVGGNMASPALDVWYEVQVTGTELIIDIPNAGLGINPNIGLWSGACGSLVGVGCATSNNALNVTFDGLIPGTYYIQVSGGNPTDDGNFTMTLQNNLNCAACLTSQSLTVSPLPTNGFYLAGTPVNFCFTVDGWTQQSTNWLEGVDLTFGAGWNVGSIVPVPSPRCDNSTGTWVWRNSVTSTATGNTYGPGFFFDRNNDGNPGNDFGDNCGSGAGSNDPTPSWQFCWTITTRTDCGAGGFDPDLSIVINTLADGEAGSWGSIACENDPDVFFSAQVTCCPQPLLSATPIVCNGQCTSTITATGQGTGPWNYTFINQGTGSTLSNQNNVNGPATLGGLCAGTYIVQTFDNVESCSAQDTIIITQPAAITGTPAVVNVTCNGGSNGSITINGTTGGTPGYQYSLNGGPFQASNAFTGLTAGTYTVTIRDINNCTTTITNITVNQPAAIAGTPVVVNVTCNGGNNGSITINPTTGGTPGYQYSLNGGPFQASNAFTGLIAGTYTVTIRDANNCTTTITNITVNQPAAITGTPAVVNVTCNGGNNGSITINGVAGGTPGYQYSLNGGPFQASNAFTGLIAGTYTVTIRDANNCTVTITNITVTQPTAITGTPAVVNVTCNGGNNGSITINGAAGGTPGYQYSLNGGPFQASNAFTGLTAGTYTVTIRDANNCTTTINNITVTQPAAITGTPAVVNVTCNGGNNGSITINGVTGGTPGYQYSLNGGPFQASNAFTGLTAGTYTVTIRDANNCTTILTNITVNQPAAITGTPTVVNVTCNGANDGSITINGVAGGTPGYQYSIGGPFQASNAFTGLGPGTYTVTIRDINNCTLVINNITVTEPTALSATVSATPATCVPGNDGTITVSGAAGGTPGYQYSIGGPFQAGTTFTGLSGGSYTVTVRDANNCTITLPITVPVPGGVTASEAVTDVTCNGGTDGQIVVTANSPNPPITYSLNGGPAQASNTFTGLGAGPYTITVTDGFGCSIVLNGTVSEPAAITGTPAVVNVTCNGGSNGSITINGAAGGTPGYQYSLNGGPFQASNAFTGLTAGTYTVTIRDANNCTTILTNITVNQPAAITGTPTVVNVTCNGASNGSITINGVAGGTPGYQYSLNGGPFQASNAFTGLGPGTYTVTIRDINNCTLVINNITVTEPTALSATVSATPATCVPGNDGTITVNTTSGGTPGYQYSIGGPFQAGTTFTGLAGGSYTVTVRDANNCTITLPITVPVPGGVTASEAVTDVTCNGGTDGQIVVTANSPNPPITYSLNGGPAQASNTFTGLGAGPYTITVTDGFGCSVVLNGTISEPTAITATTSSTGASCVPGNDGTITVSGAAGGTPGYQYSLNGGPLQASNVFTGLNGGAYVVTVQDQNGCTLTLNETVTSPGNITASSAVVDVTCPGGSNGQITITASSSNPPLQYSLNGGPLQASNVFTGLTAGLYSVSVQDGLGCTTVLPVQVNEPAAIAANDSVVDVSCNAGSDGEIWVVGVTGGTPGYQYSLNAGPFQASNGFSGLAAGTYSITVSDQNNCTITLSNIVVAEPAVLSATVASTPATCSPGNDGTVTVSNTAGGTPGYQYSIGGPFQSSPNFTGLAAGNYVVTVQDTNGCTITLPISVALPGGLTASEAVTNVTCNGGSDGQIVVTANSSNPPITYSLNGGPAQASNTFTGLAAGPYSIAVVDGMGCAFTLTGTITEPNPISGTPVVQDVTCDGVADGSITMTNVTGGVPSYSYALNGGAFVAGNSFTGLASGSYTVVIQDGNGCTDTTVQIVVSLPAPISSTPSVVDVTCNGGNTGSITMTGTTGGNPGYQYSLNGGAFQASNSFSGLVAGMYTVTVQDINNCDVLIDSIIVQEPQAFSGLSNSIDVSCFGGNDGVLSVAVQGSTPPYQYSIDGSTWQASATFNNLVAGAYTVTVQDLNGCTFTLNDTIQEPTALVVTTSTTPAICGNADGTMTANATGGTPGYTYLWSNGDNNATAVNVASGNYTVIVTDQNGCADTVAASVAGLGSPIVQINNYDDPSCYGLSDGFAIANVSGGTAPFSFLWNPGGSTSDSISGLSSGIYTVIVTDSTGCSDTASVDLRDPALLVVTADTANPTCFGANDGFVDLTVVGGTPAYSYVWSNGGNAASANNLDGGPISVSVTDANGCAGSLSFVLVEPLEVVAAFTSNPQMPTQFIVDDATVSFSNQSQNANSYYWQFGDGDTSTVADPVHMYTILGTHCVTLTAYDSTGCADTTEVCAFTVVMEEVEIPNTFTPNGDGRNDVFEIVGIKQFPNNKLMVFNRWGNLVYEKAQYTNDWDGRNFNDGKPLPDGGYFYIFQTGLEGQADFMGDVVIFR